MEEAAKGNVGNIPAGKAVPRMRTVPVLVQELHTLDPGSCVTKSYIHRLIREGNVKAFRVGKRVLINMDEVLEFLWTGYDREERAEPEAGGIRRLNAKRPS